MEILATIPVYTYPWFYNLFLAIGVVIVFVGLGFAFSSIELGSCKPLIIGLILIPIGVVIAIHSSNLIDNNSVLDYNTYKVTIDETLGARELLDKYEILSREGEIFTIKEIEVDE